MLPDRFSVNCFQFLKRWSRMNQSIMSFIASVLSIFLIISSTGGVICFWECSRADESIGRGAPSISSCHAMPHQAQSQTSLSREAHRCGKACSVIHFLVPDRLQLSVQLATMTPVIIVPTSHDLVGLSLGQMTGGLSPPCDHSLVLRI